MDIPWTYTGPSACPVLASRGLTEKQYFSQLNWDKFFIEQACQQATKSKDRSTKVGAVIIGPDNEGRSGGYNGFARGVNDDVESRHERPEKYIWVIHAELNAILNAARSGICVKGCRLYLNFGPSPCADCAKAIIQAGITEVVVNDTPFPGKGEHWEQQIKIAQEMFQEVGVCLRTYRPQYLSRK